MARQMGGRRNRSTSFGKRQDADDAFRKKKKETGGARSGRGERPERPGRSEGSSYRGSSYAGGKRNFSGGLSGDRKSFGDRRSSGEGRSSDDKKPYGEKKSFGEKRSYGEKKSYGDKKPYGDKKSFGDKKPFGEKRSYGAKKSFGEDKPYGEKKSFGRKRSFDNNDSAGERKPYGEKRSYGDKKSFGDKKPFGEKKSFGEKRPYGDKKSFAGKKPFRERKSFVESKIDNERRRSEVPAGEVREAQGAPEQVVGDGLIRLNKFISNSGVCSRREADDLIKMGVITVNGVTVTEMGHKVKPTDDVRHDGKRLTAEKPVYILLNKPKGFITTTDDPQERNTVMQLIAGACKERVYPVGRLDRNTTGLLLLTNDGDLTDKLTHPSFNAKKIYKVELDKPLTKNDFQKIVDGVRLEEGNAIVDDLAIVSDDSMTVGIELHIGWNHVVRRIFNALEYDVVKLDRVVYAGLDKKDLKRGQWRFLKSDEIVRLKHFK